MKIAEQKELIKQCISYLTTLKGEKMDKQWYSFVYKIQGEKNSCVVVIPQAEKTANKGLFHVYCRFEKTCKAGGLNDKFNCFIEDVDDFRMHLDYVLDECYSDEEVKEQLVYDACGVRDASLYLELYNQ